MRHATRHTPPSSEDARITALRGIPDPLDRAEAAQRLIVAGRGVIQAAERVRDNAIREARKPGNGTIDQHRRSPQRGS
jgi:hypothetical protein